jgi:hypothetical protein
MKLSVIIHRAVIAVLAATLAACVDVDEEFRLNSNGSGEARIRVSMPAGVMRLQGGEDGVAQLIDDFLMRRPGIKSMGHGISVKNNRANLDVRFRFDSAEELIAAMSAPSDAQLPQVVAGILGTAQIQTHWLQVRFSRVMNLGDSLAGARWLPGAVLDDHRIRTTLHLPVRAESSNAMRVEDGGRTLVWEHHLTDAVARPMKQEFTMPVPIPWFGILATVFPGLLLAGWVWFIRRRRRQRVWP